MASSTVNKEGEFYCFCPVSCLITPHLRVTALKENEEKKTTIKIQPLNGMPFDLDTWRTTTAKTKMCVCVKLLICCGYQKRFN